MQLYHKLWAMFGGLTLLVDPAAAQGGLLEQSVCISPAILLFLAATPLETMVSFAQRKAGIKNNE